MLFTTALLGLIAFAHGAQDEKCDGKASERLGSVGTGLCSLCQYKDDEDGHPLVIKTLTCGCHACQDCWRRYITQKLDENNDIICPLHKGAMTREEIWFCVPEQTAFAKAQKKRENDAERDAEIEARRKSGEEHVPGYCRDERHRRYTECKNAKCEWIEGKCKTKGELACFTCKHNELYEPPSRHFNELFPTECRCTGFKCLCIGIAKACPGCSTPVSNGGDGGGCNHFDCSQSHCLVHFCFTCGGPIGDKYKKYPGRFVDYKNTHCHSGGCSYVGPARPGYCVERTAEAREHPDFKKGREVPPTTNVPSEDSGDSEEKEFGECVNRKMKKGDFQECKGTKDDATKRCNLCKGKWIHPVLRAWRKKFGGDKHYRYNDLGTYTGKNPHANQLIAFSKSDFAKSKGLETLKFKQARDILKILS